MEEQVLKRVYSVSELTRDIRGVLEDAFREVWVEGEISNFKAHSSGHCYFSLKDDNSLLKCVLFKGASSRLKFKVEDGMSVLLFGRISVYDKQGQYQLYVDIVEPKGKGALYLAFEKLKDKLYKEGLFDEAHKKKIPFVPLRVGVVTSPTGAAVHDILNVARRRFANIEITICPVKVQGDGAREEISRAIGDLNEYNEWITTSGSGDPPVDVMIVGRGGGSLEDLWAFNEEIVARAIFASKIPVISAVGHEVDYTIADFVADRRAATPSAAAETVIPRREELEERAGSSAARLRSAITAKLEILDTELENLSTSYVLREPVNSILRFEQEVDDLARRAFVKAEHTVAIEESELETLEGKLNALSPLAVVKRGYSITFKNGAIVKDVASLQAGDRLVTRFAQGEASSRVEEVR